MNLKVFKKCGKGTYSTVTDFAKFLGWSTSVPLSLATWYASNCAGIAIKIGEKVDANFFSNSGISIE